MRLSSLTCALALATIATAAPSIVRRDNLVVHEKRAQEPRNWVLTRRLEPDAVLPLRFGLAQRNLDRLEEMLTAVAHPDSPTYGQHYSVKDIVETFAPSAETVGRVVEWLTGSGFERSRLKVSGSKGWIAVNATVEEAEALLDAEYHVYTHPETGAEQISAYLSALVRRGGGGGGGRGAMVDVDTDNAYLAVYVHSGCHSYSVPEDVREHIELIKPTVHFMHRTPTPNQLQKRSSSSSFVRPSTHIRLGSKVKADGTAVSLPPTLSNCDEIITLDCLRALYEIDHVPTQVKENTFGIREY